MPIIADNEHLIDREQRLANERKSREYIRRIFDAVMADNWQAAKSVLDEARATDEWMLVAVWAGLPGTVKEKLRELEREHR